MKVTHHKAQGCAAGITHIDVCYGGEIKCVISCSGYGEPWTVHFQGEAIRMKSKAAAYRTADKFAAGLI